MRPKFSDGDKVRIRSRYWFNRGYIMGADFDPHLMMFRYAVRDLAGEMTYHFEDDLKGLDK